MPTDTLTEAVAAMEAVWRRLREVLDGPDVAAALLRAHMDAPRPMSTAPLDGTWIMLHCHEPVGRVKAMYEPCYEYFVDERLNHLPWTPIGWSPVK